MSDPVLRGRMLYLVGGVGNAERIDVSDLFARRLADFGLQTDYVIYSRGPAPAWKRSTWRGATAYVVGRSEKGGIAAAIVNKLIELAADVRTFWMAMKMPYDVIQIRDKFVVGALCVFAARFRRTPFVYWLSYPFAESRILDAKEGRALVSWLSLFGGRVSAWLLYKIIMPRSTHIFVQSRQMMLDVAAEGIRTENMSVVPMAVDEELLGRTPVAVTPDTIVYLGTLLRVRRLEVLIEALSLVRMQRPNAKLIFVGDGEIPSDRAFLEDFAARHQLTDAVEFTGMLPMRTAHDRVAQAAVCVSPFFPTAVLLSTSPTKLVEYMALGRPVVANDHPEQSVVLGESGAGLCVPWSAEAFAEAFIHLLSDPEAAERQGAKGREYVRKHRTYAVIAKQVASDYLPLLRNRVHNRPNPSRA